MGRQKFPEREQYDLFFKEISEILYEKLPSDRKTLVDKTKSGKNWMVLKYPSKLPNAQYELHLTSDRSKNHTRHFGTGDKAVLCFFYGKKNKLNDFKDGIRSYKEKIESDFGTEVKIDNWSEDWIMIGLRLDPDTHGTKPEPYAETFARFICSTFGPVSAVVRRRR